MTRILFILKKREDYNQDPSYSGSYQVATGMWNSAKFVVDALNLAGSSALIELADDANQIDALVVQHDPQFIFIEGLWVTPAKFTELMSLPRHAGRTWAARVHSEIPFLATEGVAMDWIAQYLVQGVKVAPNAPRAHEQLRHYAQRLAADPISVPFLPNIYPTDFAPLAGLDTSSKPVLDVGCFGALRPLKNQLQQVFIASRFAEKINLPWRFHINTRVDSGGSPVYRNVAAAVGNLGGVLVEHPWEDRATFLQSLAEVDVLLQVSMSETFNIVAADATWVGRPVLASSEISWLYPLYADPQRVEESLKVLDVLWSKKSFYVQKNRIGLKRASDEALRRWLAYLG